MKTFTRNILLLLLGAALLGSCKKDTLMLYETDANIYFSQATNNSLAIRYSEVKFNFFPASVTDSILEVSVTVMGAPVDYDREIAFTFDDDYLYSDVPVHGRAREGAHFELLYSAIPAGEVAGVVRVRLLRVTNEPDDEPHFLRLRLLPNQHFNLNFPWHLYNVANNLRRDALSYSVYVSNVVTMPQIWTNTYTLTYWGVYSKAKYALIRDLTGLSAAYWEDLEEFEGRKLSGADIPVAGTKLKLYLFDEYLSGWPVKDDDGQNMDVPGLNDMIEEYRNSLSQ